MLQYRARWSALEPHDRLGLEMKLEAGEYVRPEYANEPDVLPASGRFLDAWDQLSGQRSVGMAGASELLYPAVLAWLSENGVFDLSERSLYVEMLQHMDREYLATMLEKTKPKRPSGSEN